MKQLLSILLLLTLIACGQEEKTTMSGLNPENFESIVDGKRTGLYTLKNKNGMEVSITNFGGRIVSMMVPCKDGISRDVVLGFDSIQDYLTYPTDFGASIGRYANRIHKGQFTLDSVSYVLPQNNFGHCLHGGPKGFQYQVYDVDRCTANELLLSYLSKDGEEGFPGNLICHVKMTLDDDNALHIDYDAVSDKPTIINMTNHSYFNLDADFTADNSGMLLQLNADHYTPIDSTFMTTGEIASVAHTPFDFREFKTLGEAYRDSSDQISFARGIDHNWVLNTKGNLEETCATLQSEKTGIQLVVYTSEPGIQVYSGNFLDGSLRGKRGQVYNQRASVCLETQKYPDTPNKPDWPSCILRPGQKYVSHTIYKFNVAGAL